MVNYTSEELYNALKLIQDICKEQEECCTCPFRWQETDFCGIQNSQPNEYKLVKPNEYRPFMYRG